jgi:multidrug efflux system outer membrane protein
MPTLFAIAMCAGCAAGPNYHRPPALAADAMPVAFGNASVTNAGKWKTAKPSAHPPRGDWWKLYNDPELNRIEGLAAKNNQQIAAALANFEQARAAVKAARADFFPQISGFSSATRQRTSGAAGRGTGTRTSTTTANAASSSGTAANSSNTNTSSTTAATGRNTSANTSSTGGSTGISNTVNSFNFSADASWELDLWGRVRREVEGARARFTASADDLESARLSVHAEVAIDYFTLRALDAQSAVLKQAAAAYQQALELTQNRRKAGIASELDVSQDRRSA